MMTLTVSVPPGLPDIKWVELYSKWGRFIPQEVKKQFKYYSGKPPKLVQAEVKKQSQAAKKNRQTRGRTTTGIHALAKGPKKEI